jgi:SagB-type dehydrogenase family enzyme
MKRLRHDLNYLTSAGLLVATIAAIASGIVAHLWDLKGFWYHTYSGYVMTAFAAVHVWLNWRRLVSYARFRLGGVRRRQNPIPTPVAAAKPDPQPEAVPTRHALRHAIVSRRGFMGFALGGAGGWIVGRGLRQPPAIPHGSDLGVLYHQWSKPGVIDVLGSVANWGTQPPLYKSYPDAPQIALPRPQLGGGLPTEEAINRRRSSRTYSATPMTQAELSRLLFLTGGINGERWGNRLRTAPSSGALYPIETYPVIHKVDGLSPGVYHYGVQDHSLAQLRAADLRSAVVQHGLSQEFLGQCSAVIFLTIILQRMRFRYQDRSYRYGLIEAGHLGQNLYLAATSMGMGACAIGAFMDDAINEMLGVDGVDEAAIYMLAVGKI